MASFAPEKENPRVIPGRHSLLPLRTNAEKLEIIFNIPLKADRSQGSSTGAQWGSPSSLSHIFHGMSPPKTPSPRQLNRSYILPFELPPFSLWIPDRARVALMVQVIQAEVLDKNERIVYSRFDLARRASSLPPGVRKQVGLKGSQKSLGAEGKPEGARSFYLPFAGQNAKRHSSPRSS